jgi:hypothetical protein
MFTIPVIYSELYIEKVAEGRRSKYCKNSICFSPLWVLPMVEMIKTFQLKFQWKI